MWIAVHLSLSVRIFTNCAQPASPFLWHGWFTHHLTRASCIEQVRAWPRCRVPVTLGGGKHSTNFLSGSPACNVRNNILMITQDIIWAATWQNQQNDCAPSEDSDQPGHPPCLIRVFVVCIKKAYVLSFPLSAQRRLWSDWADAQADLSLRCAHSHFVSVVIRRLIWLNLVDLYKVSHNHTVFPWHEKYKRMVTKDSLFICKSSIPDIFHIKETQILHTFSIFCH